VPAAPVARTDTHASPFYYRSGKLKAQLGLCGDPARGRLTGAQWGQHRAVSDRDDPSAAQRPSITEELSHERTRRHARRAGMHVQAVLVVALFVVIVALLLANRRTVEVSWVVGSSQQSVVWIVLVTAILGWLLGIFTSVLFRHRTRAPKR
jgi:uncharacterized integral membrane protein